MSAEKQEQFPPPPFNDADKTIVAPTDTPPEPSVGGEVGEAVSSNVETTLPEPTVADEKAGNESAEGGEEELTFDLLVELDKKNLKILLGKVSPTTLATSLSRMDTEAQDKVLGALSKTVAASLRAEIGKLGTLDDDAVEKAQDEIVEMAENLEEEGTISLDALFEEESESVAQSSAQPLSKTGEWQKTPEARKAVALEQYFGKVESGTDLMGKIVTMSGNDELQKAFESPARLNKLSGELSLKVLDFLDLVDVWEKENKNRREITESGEDFIASAKIPSGCQTAFRTIMHFAVRKKLGSVVETLKAPPATKPPETPPEAKTPRAPRTAEEIVAHYKAGKAAEEAKVKVVTSVGVEKESESAWDRTKRLFGSLIKTEGSQSEATPTVPVTAPTTEASPTASPIPPTPSTPEAVPIPSAPPEEQIAPSSRVESSVPEKISESWTPERINALTFESLPELSDNDLQSVVSSSHRTPIGWGLIVQGMPDEFVKRVRGAVNAPLQFDDWTSLEKITDDDLIRVTK